uniref:Uncharacterized protein n=2 Tax=Phaeomonas parva TaxID=124430 RepID=A0A6U4GFW1_9STRA|mmetsp:Transcript_29102/g.93109  ORF Transcript_29102/g.93109 Transcript_29102/m.93109 type:complete len:133 (+) Transcript_29102:304-702(+)
MYSEAAAGLNGARARGGAKRRRLELRTIPPPVPVSGALRDLYAYLNHQDADDGADLLKDLGRLTEPALAQRIREFENLAFRLSLDEDREMKRGLALSILRDGGDGNGASSEEAAPEAGSAAEAGAVVEPKVA